MRSVLIAFCLAIMSPGWAAAADATPNYSAEFRSCVAKAGANGDPSGACLSKMKGSQDSSVCQACPDEGDQRKCDHSNSSFILLPRVHVQQVSTALSECTGGFEISDCSTHTDIDRVVVDAMDGEALDHELTLQAIKNFNFTFQKFGPSIQQAGDYLLVIYRFHITDRDIAPNITVACTLAKAPPTAPQ